MKSLASLFLFVMWIAGFILAEGFWWTVLAVVIPLYGYYLVVREILQTIGWL